MHSFSSNCTPPIIQTLARKRRINHSRKLQPISSLLTIQRTTYHPRPITWNVTLLFRIRLDCIRKLLSTSRRDADPERPTKVRGRLTHDSGLPPGKLSVRRPSATAMLSKHFATKRIMDVFWSTWEILSMIERSTDRVAMEQCLIHIAKAFGFMSVFGGIVPPSEIRSSRVEIESRAVVQHFPDGWTRRYIEQNYLARDPIVHRLQHDRSPFSWSESYASCSEPANARVVGGEAADFGLVDGFVIPIQTLDHPLAAVSFGGMRDDLSDNDQSALAFVSNFAVGHWLALRRPKSISNTPVTPREFDCLLWAGEGKTDWEISVILGISRATVRKHILSAREKLGASNKTHAIAIAIRMKILG